jgi:hypothetical protein
MTAIVVNDQNNRHIDIDGEQMFQEGDKVFFTYMTPLQKAIDPIAKHKNLI